MNSAVRHSAYKLTSHREILVPFLENDLETLYVPYRLSPQPRCTITSCISVTYIDSGFVMKFYH